MLYAILCYDSEEAVGAWTPAEEEAVMGRLQTVEAGFAAKGQLGPVARLLPTTAATTIRKGREPLVLDGPFAETKEQLLGFFIFDLPDLDAALEAAKQLAVANSSGNGAYEVRPLLSFEPNGLAPGAQVAAGFAAGAAGTDGDGPR